MLCCKLPITPFLRNQAFAQEGQLGETSLISQERTACFTDCGARYEVTRVERLVRPLRSSLIYPCGYVHVSLRIIHRGCGNLSRNSFIARSTSASLER
jgi:hypothetical protein